VPTQRPPVEREFFTLGGRSDHLLLYQQNYDSQRALIKDALNASFATFQPLFGRGQSSLIPFQIVIWATDNPARGIFVTNEGVTAHAFASTQYTLKANVVADFPLADITGVILDDKVCYIQLHTLFFTSVHQESTIAHELSHCYQLYYIPDATNMPGRENLWWVEGSAQWLASLVYPAQFPVESSLLFRYNRDALSVAYTNLYLWAFIASSEGAGSPQAAVDYMMTMPAEVGAFPDALAKLNPSQDSVETFHRWMFALLEGRVPFQPQINLPGFSLRVVSGGEARFNTPRFSGDRAKVFGIKVEPGNRAVVTATTLLDNNYAVSAKIGTTWERLPNGREVEFCPKNGSLELLISRGSSPSTDRPDFSLIFTEKESDTPCVPKPAEEDAGACVVGNWVVIDYPVKMLGGSDFVVDTTEYTYTFNADGTYTGVYDLIAVTSDDGTTIDMSLPFSGTYDVEAGEGSVYAVNDFTMQLEPGGTATLTTGGGDSIDITDTYYKQIPALGYEPWFPAGELTCSGDSLQWTSSMDFVWILARQSE
ncbi:MAG: hypothetical protein H7X77_08110, partial [Anaerolineae bacterium]|nr:hypothetical protein [Anaerolineae bacterium]